MITQNDLFDALSIISLLELPDDVLCDTVAIRACSNPDEIGVFSLEQYHSMTTIFLQQMSYVPLPIIPNLFYFKANMMIHIMWRVVFCLKEYRDWFFNVADSELRASMNDPDCID